MHKIHDIPGPRRYHEFEFKMNLKCGRKTCGRTLGTAGLKFNGEPTYGADTDPTSIMHVDYVGDTFGWLRVHAKERVPFTPFEDPENEYGQDYKFQFKCEAEALMFIVQNGHLHASRGRDRKAMERLGCGADHIIKRETLERVLLERLGLADEFNPYKFTLGDCWAVEERLKATRGVPAFMLP